MSTNPFPELPVHDCADIEMAAMTALMAGHEGFCVGDKHYVVTNGRRDCVPHGCVFVLETMVMTSKVVYQLP